MHRIVVITADAGLVKRPAAKDRDEYLKKIKGSFDALINAEDNSDVYVVFAMNMDADEFSHASTSSLEKLGEKTFKRYQTKDEKRDDKKAERALVLARNETAMIAPGEVYHECLEKKKCENALVGTVVTVHRESYLSPQTFSFFGVEMEKKNTRKYNENHLKEEAQRVVKSLGKIAKAESTEEAGAYVHQILAGKIETNVTETRKNEAYSFYTKMFEGIYYRRGRDNWLCSAYQQKSSRTSIKGLFVSSHTFSFVYNNAIKSPARPSIFEAAFPTRKQSGSSSSEYSSTDLVNILNKHRPYGVMPDSGYSQITLRSDDTASYPSVSGATQSYGSGSAETTVILGDPNYTRPPAFSSRGEIPDNSIDMDTSNAMLVGIRDGLLSVFQDDVSE
jgi:hypothetical protein